VNKTVSRFLASQYLQTRTGIHSKNSSDSELIYAGLQDINDPFPTLTRIQRPCRGSDNTAMALKISYNTCMLYRRYSGYVSLIGPRQFKVGFIQYSITHLVFLLD
jgi:hypothetical protein